MTEKQMFMAMKVIAPDTRISMADGRWLCVMTGAEVKSGPVLISIGAVNEDINKSIAECWAKATALKADEYIVIGGLADGRRAYRWNGFMWEPLDEKRAS